MWRIELTPDAQKDLKKLGHDARVQILKYLKQRIETAENPKSFGKPLIGPLKGLWRYRVRDYRLICRFEDDTLIIEVIGIGHRKEVYED